MQTSDDYIQWLPVDGTDNVYELWWEVQPPNIRHCLDECLLIPSRYGLTLLVKFTRRTFTGEKLFEVTGAYAIGKEEIQAAIRNPREEGTPGTGYLPGLLLRQYLADHPEQEWD